MNSFGKLTVDKLRHLSETQNKEVNWRKHLGSLWDDNDLCLLTLIDKCNTADVEQSLVTNLEVLANFMNKYSLENIEIKTYIDNLERALNNVNPFRNESYIIKDKKSCTTNFPFDGNIVEYLFYIFLLQYYITPKLGEKLVYDFSFFKE